MCSLGGRNFPLGTGMSRLSLSLFELLFPVFPQREIREREREKRAKEEETLFMTFFHLVDKREES